jgi:metacaspase-1
MVKRALCVGVNKYRRADLELRGCVNDATAWASLLVEHYDFARPDVKVVTDAKATKDNVLAGLKDLLARSAKGDVLVFTNSSHGTYVADTDGDESLYDEAICPYDCETDLIVDDELRVLFAAIPKGVRMTVISDSCHSGSVTREPPLVTPDRRVKRYVDPIALGRRGLRDVRQHARPRRERDVPETDMNELLLSGCRADQYSYDARFGRRFHGAMTQTALATIAAAGHKITWNQLHGQLVPALRAANYDQEPQLEGRTTNKRRQIFT